jgi:anti-sigma factor RsiW
MTCREVAEFLQDYVAGELPPPLLEDFDRHLEACRNCREFLAQYRATIAASTAAWTDETIDPPDELVTAILQALQRQSPT